MRNGATVSLAKELLQRWLHGVTPAYLATRKEAKDRYDKQLESVLSKIEIAINTHMDAINGEVTGGECSAPKLTFNASNSNNFETPKY